MLRRVIVNLMDGSVPSLLTVAEVLAAAVSPRTKLRPLAKRAQALAAAIVLALYILPALVIAAKNLNRWPLINGISAVAGVISPAILRLLIAAAVAVAITVAIAIAVSCPESTTKALQGAPGADQRSNDQKPR